MAVNPSLRALSAAQRELPIRRRTGQIRVPWSPSLAAVSQPTGTPRDITVFWKSPRRATSRFAGRAEPASVTTARLAWFQAPSSTDRSHSTSRLMATSSFAARSPPATSWSTCELEGPAEICRDRPAGVVLAGLLLVVELHARARAEAPGQRLTNEAPVARRPDASERHPLLQTRETGVEGDATHRKCALP